MERFVYYALAFLLCLAFDPLRKIIYELLDSNREQNLRAISEKIMCPNHYPKIKAGVFFTAIHALFSIEKKSGVSFLESYKLFRKLLMKERQYFLRYKQLVLGSLLQIFFVVLYFLSSLLLTSFYLGKPFLSQLLVSLALTIVVLIVFLLSSHFLRLRKLKELEDLYNRSLLMRAYLETNYSMGDILKFSGLQEFQSKSKVLRVYYDQIQSAINLWRKDGVPIVIELELFLIELEELFSQRLKQLQKQLELAKVLGMVFFCIPLMGWNFQYLLESTFGQI